LAGLVDPEPPSLILLVREEVVDVGIAVVVIAAAVVVVAAVVMVVVTSAVAAVDDVSGTVSVDVSVDGAMDTCVTVVVGAEDSGNVLSPLDSIDVVEGEVARVTTGTVGNVELVVSGAEVAVAETVVALAVESGDSEEDDTPLLDSDEVVSTG